MLNRAPVRNPMIEAAKSAIRLYGVEPCPVVIHQRIDHVHAYSAGKSAAEYAPTSKAAGELRLLEQWIERHHAEAEPPR